VSANRIPPRPQVVEFVELPGGREADPVAGKMPRTRSSPPGGGIVIGGVLAISSATVVAIFLAAHDPSSV
jgi:hypothetical protein